MSNAFNVGGRTRPTPRLVAYACETGAPLRFVVEYAPGEREVVECEVERLDRREARVCSTVFTYDGEPHTLRCVSVAELPYELYEPASEIVADPRAAARFDVVRFDAGAMERLVERLTLEERAELLQADELDDASDDDEAHWINAYGHETEEERLGMR
jgi:hypothetical protein